MFSSKNTRLMTGSLLGALLLTGCGVMAPAAPLTEQEKEIKNDLAASSFMPASREMRDNIETQELFAQAAFWSREYDLNPSDLEATIKLASAIRKLGNPARAVEITQMARALYPRDPYLGAEFAASLIADERAADANPILDEMLRAAPNYARLWSLKGAALDQLEQYEPARKHYARALQITPHDPNILTNIGLSYALSGDPATAEGWLRRAASMPGATDAVMQNLNLVMQLQGKMAEAAPMPAAPRPQSRPAYPQNYAAQQQPTFAQRPQQPQAMPQMTPQAMPQNLPQTTAPQARPQGYPPAYAPQPQQAAPQTAAQTQRPVSNNRANRRR